MKNELSKKNKADLVKELDEKIISLRGIRFGASGGNNKNVKEYKNIKKGIAKIKTALNNMN